MAVAEIGMLIAGARKAVQFCEAVAEANGDFQQCVGKIQTFFNCADAIREAEVKAESGDYFSRNSPEAEALQNLNARYQMEQMENQLRTLIVWNMSEQHYKDMMRDRKRIRERRMALAKARAARRKMMIDGTFVLGCTAFAIGLIVYTAVLIMGYSD